MDNAVSVFTPDIHSAANPCVRNCCLDDDNICLGCGRSLPEILEWHHAGQQRHCQIRLAAQQRLASRAE